MAKFAHVTGSGTFLGLALAGPKPVQDYNTNPAYMKSICEQGSFSSVEKAALSARERGWIPWRYYTGAKVNGSDNINYVEYF